MQRLEDPGAQPLLHLSKGVHVVFPAERLPVRHLLVLAAEDRRSIFAIRVGEVVYLGTTDTSHPQGESVWPEISERDVAYLTRPIEQHLRCAAPRPDEAVAAGGRTRRGCH